MFLFTVYKFLLSPNLLSCSFSYIPFFPFRLVSLCFFLLPYCLLLLSLPSSPKAHAPVLLLHLQSLLLKAWRTKICSHRLDNIWKDAKKRGIGKRFKRAVLLCNLSPLLPCHHRTPPNKKEKQRKRNTIWFGWVTWRKRKAKMQVNLQIRHSVLVV